MSPLLSLTQHNNLATHADDVPNEKNMMKDKASSCSENMVLGASLLDGLITTIDTIFFTNASPT